MAHVADVLFRDDAPARVAGRGAPRQRGAAVAAGARVQRAPVVLVGIVGSPSGRWRTELLSRSSRKLLAEHGRYYLNANKTSRRVACATVQHAQLAYR